MKTLLLFLCGLILTCQIYGQSGPIIIKGSNGSAVPIAGIRAAEKGGLWLKVKPDSKEVPVPWNKFDLKALETDHPEIFKAYQTAQSGQSVTLELGTYERALTNLAITEVIKGVEKHEAAQGAHARADELNFHPYLYETGNDDLPMPFRFYAPDIKHRAGDKQFPLVVWLHGAGGGGDNNTKNVQMTLANMLIGPDGTKKDQCFLLFPQYQDDYNWWTYTSDKRGFKKGTTSRQLLDLLDQLCEKMPAIDPNRLYIMGMSQGGFGIPFLTTAYPNRFAASVMFAGTQSSMPYTKENVIPSWIIYSTDDKIVVNGDNDAALGGANAMREVARDPDSIKLTTYNDAGHGGTLKRGFTEAGLIDWVFSQKNENVPKRDEELMSKHFD